ncbi:MAG TPA: PaaI family thioesterase [Halanaerobiales bacterium]|nr:PaaI family thioesterase [Halanaerobiales bacterium]
MDLGNDKMCFACGEDNPISLGLKFAKIGNKKVKAEFIPQDVHQGYDGIMHGGLITTLLDEAMAKVLTLNNIAALTAKMNIRFKHPLPIGTELVVTAEIIKNKTGLYFTEAEVRSKEGKLFAKAEAKFMKVREAK